MASTVRAPILPPSLSLSHTQTNLSLSLSSDVCLINVLCALAFHYRYDGRRRAYAADDCRMNVALLFVDVIVVRDEVELNLVDDFQLVRNHTELFTRLFAEIDEDNQSDKGGVHDNCRA